MSEQEIEMLEMSIEAAKKSIELGDALQRLSVNQDFMTLIHEQLFKEEAARLVLLLADPSLQSEKHQASLHTRMQSIAYFRDFLRVVNLTGTQAKETLDADRDTHAEILAEDA